MSTTIKQERDALQAVIVAMIPRLNVYSRWPDTPEMPAALIKPSTRREDTQNGGITRRYSIEILVPAVDNDDAQLELDEYLDETGTYSVKRAIDNDPTLGGVVPNCIYVGWYDYGGRRTETTVYIGASIDVEIWL